MKTIKSKVAHLALSVSLFSIIILGIISGVVILRVLNNTVAGLDGLKEQATADSTNALQAQKQEELLALRDEQLEVYENLHREQAKQIKLLKEYAALLKDAAREEPCNL